MPNSGANGSGINGNVRKNTLLVFSKVPEPGLVKTRLSTLKDGWFKPEIASWLYHCMLFDMVETCCAALAELEAKAAVKAHGNAGAGEGISEGGPVDVYELVISTAPAENLGKMKALFDESGAWPYPITFDYDEGASFDEHYNDAFEKCWQRGSHFVLSMGADMPALTTRDVVLGFEELHAFDGPGVVLAPDQEMGVSTVGWSRDTPFDHDGVFYNRDGITVMPAYIRKARDRGIPVRCLPAIPDVDTMADLMHNATIVEALCYSSASLKAASGGSIATVCPWRTADALAELRLTDLRVRPNDLMDPRNAIDK